MPINFVFRIHFAAYKKFKELAAINKVPCSLISNFDQHIQLYNCNFKDADTLCNFLKEFKSLTISFNNFK